MEVHQVGSGSSGSDSQNDTKGLIDCYSQHSARPVQVLPGAPTMCYESSFPHCIHTWVKWSSQVPGLGNVLQSVKSGDKEAHCSL